MGIVVRLFQFMNSFYRDKAEGDFGVSGEYCCLGYFDALNVNLIGTFENELARNMRENVYEQVIKTINGKCSQKNIICVTENEEKDAEFWKKKEQMPYLFVTMMHVQQDENDGMYQTKAFMKRQGNEQETIVEAENQKEESLVECVNKSKDSIAYYTYDHCEVVIAHYGKSYEEGVEFIFELLEDKRVYKLYSTFCILQELVEDKNKLIAMIDKEKVSCLLRVSLKDFKEYKIFLEELKKKFSNRSEENKTHVEAVETNENTNVDKGELSEIIENKAVVNAELSEMVKNEMLIRAETSEGNETMIREDLPNISRDKTTAGVETSDVSENEERECVVAHKVLGSKDIVIELKNVPFEELIECYSMNKEDRNDNLLNHNNQFYKKAFFNVETEILKTGRRGEVNG